MSENVLDVKNLSLEVEIENERFKAVDNISFYIKQNEILGIIGESGCGKSLTALAIQGLLQDNIFAVNGNIFFNNVDLLSLQEKQRRKINGHNITMIFQEPMSSLNPLMKTGKQIEEVLLLHTNKNKKEIHKEAVCVLEQIGIFDAENVMKKYPHQLSGGMRQRIMIAMSVICHPQLLIADESTTALDVTTQAHVLELLKKLNREQNVSILFITHDLAVAANFCDRILVMYGGKIMEGGYTKDVLTNPKNPYTKGLLSSIPPVKKQEEALSCIKGKVPTITEKKMPCPFAPRCSFAKEVCFLTLPEEKNLGNSHIVFCHVCDLLDNL